MTVTILNTHSNEYYSQPTVTPIGNTRKAVSNVMLYTSDGIYTAANARISNFQAASFPLPQFFSMNVEKFTRKANILGYVDLPRDYYISFDVLPIGTINTWSGILQLTTETTAANSIGSSLPSVMFCPGGFNIFVNYSDSNSSHYYRYVQ